LDAPVTTTLQGLRDRAILCVFLFHGIWRAEGAALTVGSLADRRGVTHFTIHGKGSKIRYLPAHPVAVAAVKEYLEAASHGTEKDGPLFRRFEIAVPKQVSTEL
jgi:site-specific recombinase XerD